MPELPPPFFTAPAPRLHVEDEAFTGPTRLARETAVATLSRDDRAMADTLGRAWRSDAPDDLLSPILATYAAAHELEDPESDAIAAAAHFVLVMRGTRNVDDVDLLREVAMQIEQPLRDALAAAQAEEEPCRCEVCIAQAAALN